LGCFSDDFLAAYLERTVSPRELEEAEAHLEVCDQCRAHVAAFARLAAHDPEATRRDPQTRVTEPTPAIQRSGSLVGHAVAGRYLIEHRLGGGGMGVVYGAHDQLMDRRVAIKLIAPRFSHNAQAEPRFLRECRLAARISHPNAAMVLDHGRLDDGQLYLVMELLVGRTLHEHLLAGSMSEPRALHIASQICDALDAAHRLQIVHRDLKPANIVILDDPPGRDFVKVLDFGIARSLAADGGDLTRTNVAIGTPAFAAPEVLTDRGVAVDQRADLYSLGVVLYWMLAGVPLVADTALADRPPRRPPLDHVRAELAELVDQLLAAEPEERPTTAAEVRARMAAIASPPPAAAPPPARRRRAPAIALASAVAVVSLIAVSLAVRAARDESEQPSTPAATASPVQAIAETSAQDASPPAPPDTDAAPSPATPVMPDAGAAAEPEPEPGSRRDPPRKKRRQRPGSQRPAAPDSTRPGKTPADRPEYFRP
jgi:serine/threonine protein kinase